MPVDFFVGLSAVSSGITITLTIVTKQDLWWPERNEVESHYTTGKYNSIIHGIRAQKGNENFSHEYLSLSNLINNFRIGSKVYKETTQGYDQLLQLRNLENVLIRVEEMIKS